MLRHGQCCHEGERDELKELTPHGHKQAEDGQRKMPLELVEHSADLFGRN